MHKKDRQKVVEINPRSLTHMHRFTPSDGALFPEDRDPIEDDVIQGGIGNCWFLASILAVLFQPRGPKFIKSLLLDVSADTPLKPLDVSADTPLKDPRRREGA